MKALALLAVSIALFQGSFFLTLAAPARTASPAAQAEQVHAVRGEAPAAARRS
ncbi:MAG: hypothetical protein QM767_05385 [Anaeromyxobacter sp.]